MHVMLEGRLALEVYLGGWQGGRNLGWLKNGRAHVYADLAIWLHSRLHDTCQAMHYQCELHLGCMRWLLRLWVHL